MKSVNIYFMIMLGIFLASCEMKCSVGDNKDKKTKTVSSSDNSALNGAIIKNDIDIEVTGVKLKSAYLLSADEKELEENVTRAGEKIYIVIKLDTGWVKENGKSYIGAAERISTSGGTVIVNADDIFKDYEVTGMDATDSKVVSLSAVVTEVKPGDEFVVQFRVWDKKGSGEVKGKYKFRVKE
jgi:hypothetical protein